MLRTSALLLASLLLAAPARAETLYVHAGRLVDPAKGEAAADRRIKIVDGRIAEVSAWAPPPADGRVLDWSRYTVLPGLIDLHTHVADGFGQTDDPAEALKHSEGETALKGAEAARTMLRAGFTTVRDVGAYRGLSDVTLRDAIAKGWVEGPRMVVAGAYITKPGGGGAVTGAPKGTPIPAVFRMGEARNPAEAQAKVRALIGGGADFIKIIASGAVLAVGSEPGALELDEPTIKAACDEAKALGKYCIAHAHGAAAIKAAIRAGARTIEHASLIDDEGIALAKARGVWLDMDIYNGDWIEEVGTREHWPAEYLRKNRETTDVQREGFRKAVAAGVKLTFGTDAAVYPYGLGARQFAYMVRFGMTPAQAIRAATTEAAAALRMEREIGRVEPGFAGDLIAVEGDPLADVKVLETVAGVVKAGKVAAP
ncbi:amidohydrolase family protein [Phenylobacterium sp.]|uniref:metal-dependent hydrolase family protein n=1 Tax=Phenylobacterium sp. TaxID=1871053 RepID=UPI0025D9891B|nr:amidohydrolase family protein [Phenylobacterium sp.]